MVDSHAVFARRDAFTRGWDDEKLLVPAILETGTDLLCGIGNRKAHRGEKSWRHFQGRTNDRYCCVPSGCYLYRQCAHHARYSKVEGS